MGRTLVGMGGRKGGVGEEDWWDRLGLRNGIAGEKDFEGIGARAAAIAASSGSSAGSSLPWGALLVSVPGLLLALCAIMAGVVPYYKLKRALTRGGSHLPYRRAQTRAFLASSLVIAVVLGSTLLPILYWKSTFLRARLLRSRHSRVGSFRPSCTFIGGKHWLYGTPDMDVFNAQSFCELGAVCFDLDPKNSEISLGRNGYDSAIMEETCDAVYEGSVIHHEEVLSCPNERRRILAGSRESSLGIGSLKLLQHAYDIVESLGYTDPMRIAGTTVILPPSLKLKTLHDFLMPWGSIFQIASNSQKLGLRRVENIIFPEKYEPTEWQESLYQATLGSEGPYGISRTDFTSLAGRASFKPICFENLVVLSRSPTGGSMFANMSVPDDSKSLFVPVDSLRVRSRVYGYADIPNHGLNPGFENELQVKLKSPSLRVGVLRCSYLPYQSDNRYRQEPGFCIENFEELMKGLRSVTEKYRIAIVELRQSSVLKNMVTDFHSVGVLVAPHGSLLTNAMFLPPAGTLVEIRPEKAPEGKFEDFASARNIGIRHHILTTAQLHLPPLSSEVTKSVCKDPTSEKCILAKKNGNLFVAVPEVQNVVQDLCLRLRRLQPFIHLTQTLPVPFGFELMHSFRVKEAA